MLLMPLVPYTQLQYINQFVGHTSQPTFLDPANNFFLIYGDFGDLLEKLKSHMLYKLIDLVQYYAHARNMAQ